MLLEVCDLSYYFKTKEHFYLKSKKYEVFKNISLQLELGDKLELSGSNGSGKSTLVRMIAMLLAIQKGNIFYEGISLKDLSFNEKLQLRNEIILILQNQKSSLNPHKTIKWHFEIIECNFNKKFDYDLLEDFYLNQDILNKYPNEISGGQAQTIGLLRGLLVNPKLLILDEIDAGMDRIVLDKCLNVLKNYDKSIIFISHEKENSLRVCNKEYKL